MHLFFTTKQFCWKWNGLALRPAPACDVPAFFRTAEQDGKEIKLPADTVIIAAGLAPKLDEAEAFRSCAPEFWKIGDCRQARNVRLAIHEGYDAGSYIE